MNSVDKLRARIYDSTLSNQTRESMEKIADEIEREIERDYMRLPVDADGETIKLDDVLQIDRGGSVDIGEVTDIHLQTGKCAVSICFEYDSSVTAYPEDYTHYHAPTVEDVLREFVRSCMTVVSYSSGYPVIDVDEDSLRRWLEENADKLREVLCDE